jgi:hypothetical protein
MIDEWHFVKPKDRKRIQCQRPIDGPYGDSCGKPAHFCRYTYWTVGKRRGLSFSYYCKSCKEAVR